ncbi:MULTISPECIES: hypothetical protein [Bacillus]|uniref:Uncharacterized protein n=1 Tax=Bacillus wiedmannii TaxID=1890302 RepID=A0A2B6RP38_9BACI|nr:MULTISPECIES: hypothetical protein [Bacillus]MDF9664033.1 hypothetical protein [Bacillus wiedmannii]PGC10534.1 hypothetical protein COM08_30490 [Bacillus wiedmannii]PGD30201.1 hypothetical protein COM27_25505 [Bacillus wiedmannii]
MSQFIVAVVICMTIVVSPYQAQASTSASLPCSVILNPLNKVDKNAKGVALVYKVKLTASFPRTNISILGVHLPNPNTLGNYDTYEGFAFIPEKISWRFRLYPSEEDDGPTWAGRIDIITAEMKGVQIQVRPSNSKTEKLGLPVLTNSIKACK